MEEDNSTADSEAAADAVPVRQRRKRWRVARWLSVLFVLPFALVLAVLLWAFDRRIPAPDWVAAELETRAAQVLAGGSLDVADIALTVGRDLHPRVQLRDITVRDAAGVPLARIPLAAGLFSPRGVLFKREALLQDLHVRGAQINLRRARDGAVALSFQSGATEVEEAASFFDLLDQSDAIFDQPVLEALETIRADGLIINYVDERAGRAWTVDGGALSLDVRDGMTKLGGEFAVLSGGAGITTLQFEYASPRGSSAADFKVALSDAQAADIAAQTPALSWLAGINAPLSATLESARRADGSLAPLSATLALSDGVLQPNAATDPIAFDAARIALTFDPGRNVIAFDEVTVDGDLGRMRAEGQALLGTMENGLPEDFVGQFTFTDTQLKPPGLALAPIDIPAMQVDMKLGLAPFALDFGQIFAQFPTFDVYGSGRVQATDAGWNTTFDLRIPEVDHASLLNLWPEGQVQAVREWIVGAISSAQYTDVVAHVRKLQDAPIEVAGSFGYSDMALKYLGTMPPITEGVGTGTFTNEIFAIAVNSGGVTAPTGGRVTLDGSTMIIPDLTARFRPADYDLRGTGRMTDLLALLDLPPMGYMTLAKLPVDVTEGTATVKMTLNHPMKRGMTGADVSFAAEAEVRDVVSDQLIPGRNLEADLLRVRMDKSALIVSGNALVDGVPLVGTFTQRFTGEGGALEGIATLNEARIREFGVDLPQGTLTGTGTATLALRFPPNAAPRYDITSDLVGFQVAVPAVGWAKPPNTPGRLVLSGRLGTDPQVDRLEVAGGGLEARGDVTFQPDGSLERVRFDRVQIGNWLNAPITLRGRGAGRALGVQVGGGVIDLRRARFGSGSGESGPIAIALDRLQVTEGITLNRFVGEFTSAGGFSGTFTAWINNVGQIQGTVAPRNGRSAVRILSNDAGGVALSTGLMRNAVGGSLELTLLPTGGNGTFDGQLAIRDLRIRDAPAIAALLDAISVVGLLQQLDGQGLSFDAVDARFRLTPQQVIVTESSAVGPGLGISLDGIYTLATQQMDFQGVVSPFYLVNSIGSIFTRRGEGLIGFNFNIGGTSSNPAVTVNPLSALTPGMFREIFRRNPPQVTQ